MKQTITLLMLATAITLSAQQSPVAAKPAEVKAASALAKPPAIQTSKLWRLVSKAQALRVQLDASEAGKAVKEAEAELQAEQAALSARCAEVGMVLGYDNDKSSPSYQDVNCQPKQPEQAKAEPQKGK